MRTWLALTLAAAMLALVGCSASKSPESIEAEVLGAAAASLGEVSGNTILVMNTLATASPQIVVTQIGPTLGPPITDEAQAAIRAAVVGGPQVRFIDASTDIVDPSGISVNGCHAFIGLVVTFSVPAPLPDGTYEVARLENQGCTGTSYLFVVSDVDGHFVVTHTVHGGQWIV